MLATPALMFWEVALAVHIMAVVVGFGVTFAYPIIFPVIAKVDKRALPAVHRAQHAVGSRLITPSLAVVVIAGIYLASHLDQWSKFYVQWGLAAAVVLGGLGGMFFAPSEKRLAELAERDTAAASDGEVTMSADYEALSGRVAKVGALSSLLVLVTVYFMATHTGA